MAIPETELHRIRRWAEQRVPKQLWSELKVEADVGSRHVTIVEVRPPWDGRGEHTASRSRVCTTRPRPDCGRSAGEIGTSSSTSTTAHGRRRTFRSCSTTSTARPTPLLGLRSAYRASGLRRCECHRPNRALIVTRRDGRAVLGAKESPRRGYPRSEDHGRRKPARQPSPKASARRGSRFGSGDTCGGSTGSECHSPRRRSSETAFAALFA